MTNESPDRPVLSPSDRALLKSYASPTDAQVEDNRRAIGLRIAALAAGATAAHAASTAQATGSAATTTATTGATAGATGGATKGLAALGAAKWIGVGIVLTAVAGGAVVATRPDGDAPGAAAVADAARLARAPQPAPVAPLARPMAAPAAVDAAATALAPAVIAQPAASQEVGAPHSAARRTAAHPPKPAREAAGGSLAGELALLRSARQALESKDAGGALEQLDAHAARYPRAALRQEALAARVLALCALGRQAEARRTAAQLARLAPRSPHLIRLADSCAGDAPDSSE